jgi:hypothetical protein
LTPYNHAELAAARATGSRYVNVVPWFCSAICTAIIGHYEVYVDRDHITNSYARYLEGVLGDALRLPVLQQLQPPGPDPYTTLVQPSAGSTLSGSATLDALASDNVRITGVQFRIDGGSLQNHLIATGEKTQYGWIARWDTRAVPNGDYDIQSVVRDAAGKVARSAPVAVVVKNAAPNPRNQ